VGDTDATSNDQSLRPSVGDPVVVLRERPRLRERGLPVAASDSMSGTEDVCDIVIDVTICWCEGGPEIRRHCMKFDESCSGGGGIRGTAIKRMDKSSQAAATMA
jgi:hypothetical protein